jgi:peptidoglycan/xylan/chitin deacetylase (PgdA/CDA1 family)
VIDIRIKLRMIKINIKSLLEILLICFTAISIAFNIYFFVKINQQDIELVTKKNNIRQYENSTKKYQDTIKEYEDTLKNQDVEIKKLQDQVKDLQGKISYVNSATNKCKTQQPISGKYTKVAYLTFDDGPSSFTSQFIDVLNSCGVKGTFFVMGSRAKNNPNTLKRIISSGNQIGNHSYVHDYRTVYASSENFLYDLNRTEQIIYDITGVKTNYYRFPGGSSTSTTTSKNIRDYIVVLNSKNYTYYDWNVSSGDGAIQTTESVINNVTNGIKYKTTAVILMHDTHQTTLNALPEVIRRLKEQGFLIKPLDNTVVMHHNLK